MGKRSQETGRTRPSHHKMIFKALFFACVAGVIEGKESAHRRKVNSSVTLVTSQSLPCRTVFITKWKLKDVSFKLINVVLRRWGVERMFLHTQRSLS